MTDNFPDDVQLICCQSDAFQMVLHVGSKSVGICCREFFRPPISSFDLYLSNFLKCFKDTLHIIPRYVKFSANSSLGNNFLVQKYHFTSAKLCYV